MGYRLSLGKIPKAEKAKYAGMSFAEVEALLEVTDDHATDPLGYVGLYELGKYVDFNNSTEAFYDFDIGEEIECEFCIMNKDNLLHIIDEYHNNTNSYYTELLEYHQASEERRRQIDIEKMTTGRDFLTSFLQQRIDEWTPGGKHGGMRPYYLDEVNTDGDIVKSWSYEYAIFNLTHMYRTFDWENDYLIYSGS